MLLAATGSMFVFARSQEERIDRSEKAAELAAVQGIRLVTLIKTIQIDVIQVQQWLTDISATRGQDGLNDGYEEAERPPRIPRPRRRKLKSLPAPWICPRRWKR